MALHWQSIEWIAMNLGVTLESDKYRILERWKRYKRVPGFGMQIPLKGVILELWKMSIKCSKITLDLNVGIVLVGYFLPLTMSEANALMSFNTAVSGRRNNSFWSNLLCQSGVTKCRCQY
jgi:hypothetical protein